MFDIKKGIIKITKGDSAAITVELKNADGTIYEMQDGDLLTLTVRKKPESEVLLESTTATNTISLTADKTSKLEVGNCCYDIELNTADNEVYTVIGLTDSMQFNMVVYPEVTESAD